jgi:peptide/nickel transport system substrate-binding protein
VLPDPARAQELADRYVEEHGEPLSFVFTVNADAQGAELGQFVEQQLGAYGITVEVQQVEQVKSIADVLTGDYEAGFFAMINAPTLDSGYAFIATEPTAEGISRNHTRLDDPEIRRAMDAARTTGDVEERIDEYRIVQQQMAENLDRIFLYHVRSADAFTNQIHGFTATTFPGTSERAFAPDITYPFFTDMWVEQ